MILVIEAGGTKSNLAFVNADGVQAMFVEPGLQLSRESEEDFIRKVQHWADLYPNSPETVWIFAAGSVSNQKMDRFKSIIQEYLKCSKVNIESDLLGACYATASGQPGIVGILGTGSNTCYYDGNQIVHHVSPGGYILGDEGSGTFIGKMFLRDYLRNNVPSQIRTASEKFIGLSKEEIISQLYGGSVKDSAYYCAMVGGFVIDQRADAYCQSLCTSSIRSFLDIIDMHYSNYSKNLWLVGSVGHYLQDIIREETMTRNINLIKIVQHPINELSLFLARREYK